MSGIFPDDWKCARVTPLLKQGESFDLPTYLSHFRKDCVRSVLQLLKGQTIRKVMGGGGGGEFWSRRNFFFVIKFPV